jgi:RimJ/RimL family protein N-acetyltransferase
MGSVQLRPLTDADLSFVSEVRHHPETLSFLHDQRIFSAEQMREWMRSRTPEWYMVEADGTMVGYVRISDRDSRNQCVKVGCDIHPRYRRRGFATAAYHALFDTLRWEGCHRVWLEVLPDNAAAISLYEKLGFLREGRLSQAVRHGNTWWDSLVMGRLVVPDTGINAKVVAVYIGQRRANPGSPQDAYDLLRFLLDKEVTVDPGCSADTIIVYNKDSCMDEHRMFWARRAEEVLAGVDGLSTPRGRFRVIVRDNIGLSFGAFNHAFTYHMTEYDHWFFTEDDQVVIHDGCFASAIEQMQSDPQLGFVAIVGVSEDTAFPPHAHGGVGVSSRSVLRQVLAANRCERHPRGHLPYHWERGYDEQECKGEIRFTNAIHQLGYRLSNLNKNDVCVAWRDAGKRTPRMVPWSHAMTDACPS